MGLERPRDRRCGVGGTIVKKKNSIKAKEKLPSQPFSDMALFVFDDGDAADLTHFILTRNPAKLWRQRGFRATPCGAGGFGPLNEAGRAWSAWRA
ncbi:hypothetical protein [Acidocella sp.]|uniref:hypothetical protein n=1 Tax=Acidocella sp. TaxID=50710 RepID=UPI00262A4509|nr:hypothetical protein [Acidocella sp.]